MSKESTLGRYSPGVPPTNAEELPLFIQGNLGSIASMVNSPMKNFAPLNKAPEKPREGDIAFANGDSWNPGAGRGLYMYTGEEWVLVADSSGTGGAGTPVGAIIMYTSDIAPDHWAVCDGTNAPNGMATPDLRNKFIKGSGTQNVGANGGSSSTDNHVLTTAEMPSHNHSGPSHTHTGPSHTHPGPSHTHTQQGTFGSNGAGNHNHNTNVISTKTEYGTAMGSVITSTPGFPLAIPNSGDHSHSTTISGQTGHTAGTTGSGGTGNTGSGGTGSTGSKGSSGGHDHTFEPPYYVLTYIMKYD